jgi:predicted alpha/beta hydrolase
VRSGRSGAIRRNIQIATEDGQSLAGTWFLPANNPEQPIATVLVVCGGGIPASRYHHFAHFIAENGAAALTFDYRGMGASRHGSMRDLVAATEHWGVFDLGGAMAIAKATYPNCPLHAVAHSVGGLLLGAAPDAPRLQRIVLFGPHTGYCGDYGPRWRSLLYLTWHVLMPIVTKIVGYFPGRALGLGEDLPRGFALDWAARCRPELAATDKDRARFAPILANYKDVTAQTLVISVTDDAFAPPSAARRLLEAYPNIHVTHEVLSPANLGYSRLGHFAFLRRGSGPVIWHRAAAWLLHASSDGRASGYSASANGVPPSGTKGDALAGSATL